MDERNLTQEDLLHLLRNLEDQITPIQVSDDALAMREDGIKTAIAIGGRVNGVDLLHLAAQIVNQTSPALAAWLDQGVNRILAGDSADDAYGVSRKRGLNDPLANRNRLLDIARRVDDARAKGFKTQASGQKGSCFDVVAEEMGCDEATIRKAYYKWEVVDDIHFPHPPDWPAHLDWPPTKR